MTLLEIGQQKLNQCTTCMTHTRIMVKEKWPVGEPFTIIIKDLPPLTRDEKEQQCNGCYTILDKEGYKIDFEEYFNKGFFR